MKLQKDKPQEEYAFSFILEVLTQGLYPNVLDVVREYVQNSYDAILKHLNEYHRQDYKIQININGRSLFIADNGIGMTEEQIKQYRYVGFSEKKLGEEAGFRGIGKLSGISVADKLIVTSKAEKSLRRYKLVFDAQAMLSEIMKLKREGKNKPLNELIQDNTELGSEEESTDSHYTVVELYNIRAEHSILLDPTYISNYVSQICPVPFHSSFKYHNVINKWLLEHVKDYVFLPHLINDQPVYKPFTNFINEPHFYEIEREEGGDPIAYAWVCVNLKEEQLPDTGPRGISFRQKNISIGDHEYTRTLLWKTSGHLAYWFLGEIHVVGSEILPSSERSGFIDNNARQRLVKRSQVDLIKNLTKLARERSGRANAEKKLEELVRLVNNTELALSERGISRESSVYEAAKVLNALEKAQKSTAKLPTKSRDQAKIVHRKAEELIRKLNISVSGTGEALGVFDIKKVLTLTDAEWGIYDLIVETLKDYYVDNTADFSYIIKRLHERMIKKYGQK
jgi:molecular chaperone HtpG